MSIVVVDFSDGSRVIGKHFPAGSATEGRIAVSCDPLYGTFIHIESELPQVASFLVKTIKELMPLDKASNDLLENVLYLLEKSQRTTKEIL
ncbi:hypothetical protein A3I18_00870 [Candidatus Campbellbacteria bacterium RIFCSPLOWO2_02_FULL_35_11]|uniref:Uncharacterized protein n=2 Tax=Candidatus Campbelliibacteriota TaxID=1752727 RepID=A0A1F5EQI7_9BACT|nr:MAG: hypothetical protein A3I18_00870 [Candidatus Campbellbacteria bacterium RIFCSPLOWO2_02_FULL_35_11]OGD69667.1 MAG: hypothetical protein A3E89_01315 [Candidatus Campbellbacteria bacterium RIFCSPHIGHO2_12_FULL_35_10]